VLNTLLKMDQINSQLSPFESREILLKTVYVPKNKVFHVRSAGILHPRRALMATKLYKKGLSIDQAVIRAREILNDSQEINDFTKLSEIWEKNKLRF
jgi:hypothetical protein